MSQSKLSLPREHGASIMLGAGAVGALWLAPDRIAALSAAAGMAAAFLARGPVERAAARLRLRAWDVPALGAYVVIVAAVAATVDAGVLLGGAAALLVLAGAIARHRRQHRALAVEAAGMAALGGVGGLIAMGGGASWQTAALLGGAVACYAGATALFVRAETRPATPRKRAALAAGSLAILALGAGASAGFAPLAAAAFAPRAVHTAWRGAVAPAKRRMGVIAARECVELAIFLLVLLYAGSST